ncbi:hypothetical protein GCM10009030_19580 [Haloarcula pellucida]|uniref:Uncharacterized protein n=1 Tax=Haloarcula pellucida TaxID=1427151 RepID=A0A830GNX1_9EURY|nr:hypothetical protein GCM10009030_19580 [Halomicroarcula pellucida]
MNLLLQRFRYRTDEQLDAVPYLVESGDEVLGQQRLVVFIDDFDCVEGVVKSLNAGLVLVA